MRSWIRQMTILVKLMKDHIIQCEFCLYLLINDTLRSPYYFVFQLVVVLSLSLWITIYFYYVSVFLTVSDAHCGMSCPLKKKKKHPDGIWPWRGCVHDKFCSKHMHPFKQTYLPLQVHTRSCKKSDDIWPLKNTGTNRFFFSHSNKRGDFGDGFGDQSVYAARQLVSRLYDQKEKLTAVHVDLNKLRVRLATLKDACLAKLPPCEVTDQYHSRQGLTNQ
jgi:hypothetical protein